MNITIRRGVPADAASLAALAARTFHDTFASDSQPDDMVLHLTQAYGALQQGQELADPNVTTCSSTPTVSSSDIHSSGAGQRRRAWMAARRWNCGGYTSSRRGTVVASHRR